MTPADQLAELVAEASELASEMRDLADECFERPEIAERARQMADGIDAAITLPPPSEPQHDFRRIPR